MNKAAVQISIKVVQIPVDRR